MAKFKTLMMCILFAAAGAKASLVEYKIDFTVDSAFNGANGTFNADGYGHFSYQPEIGDVFSATIGFDDCILGTVWDPGDPTSQFSGFRGLGLSSISPILEVRDHQLVGLLGDVYGIADCPFADFLPDGSFSAVDLGTNVLIGSMQVAGEIPSVPEPSSILLFGIALLIPLCFSHRPGEKRYCIMRDPA
ncbi:MAG: PEP-CTERM sorting domain-containing protein [Fibrobacteres bacterium]|nr:PEP-CTERM sorting domain-containing protein [Fibrobacterota bacterium]